MINIKTASFINQNSVNQVKELIQLLTEPRCEITIDSLNKIVQDDESELLIAENELGEIVGFMCLIIYTIPSTKKAFIEDVVLSESVRGLGIGKEMVLKAIQIAKERGVRYIELSSNSKRVAANSLYKKLGFKIRDTNFYRMEL